VFRIYMTAIILTACTHTPDTPEHYISRAIDRYGSGSIEGVSVTIAPAWELTHGGSCIDYSIPKIEVASGPRWRQDLMHEVTHWLLYLDGHAPGTHHPIMYGLGLCYGGCHDVPQIVSLISAPESPSSSPDWPTISCRHTCKQ
jgi:hypothetical protein